MEFIVDNVNETKKIAKKFAKLLVGGEIILLNGDLGAGKTTFTRYVLRALGVKDDVTSPTFTIMREYQTKKFDIIHFDMYRLNSGKDAQEYGLEEYIFDLKSNQIVFMEWSKNIEDILNGDYIKIDIELLDDNKRKFTINR